MSRTIPGKRVQHDHGTRARYVTGCRCADCRRANTAAYHDRMARAREAAAELELVAGAGEICPGIEGQPCPKLTKLRSDSTGVCADCRSRLVWNGLVDAAPARRHLRRLSRRGIGYKTAADAAGIAASIVAAILNGKRRRIRKRTADAILEVDQGAAADHALVDAGETWRMLKHLRCEYLTDTALARALGFLKPALQIGQRRVLVRTEDRVRRLYRRVYGDSEP